MSPPAVEPPAVISVLGVISCDESACTTTPDQMRVNPCTWGFDYVGGECKSRMRVISDYVGVGVGSMASSALALDAPPCGTPEAKEWGVCTRWTIRPGMTADRLWRGPSQ